MILDCVGRGGGEENVIEPTEEEWESNSIEDESLVSASTLLAQALCKLPPVTDPAYHLQGGLKIHKTIYVPPSEKKKRAA